MSRTSLCFILPLSACLAIPSSLQAQRSAGGRPAGGVIDVQVRYANGAPGPRGIHIRLEAAEGGPAGDCETIEGGKCQFNLASSGVYMVRMSERGFDWVLRLYERTLTAVLKVPIITLLVLLLWAAAASGTHSRNAVMMAAGRRLDMNPLFLLGVG